MMKKIHLCFTFYEYEITKLYLKGGGEMMYKNVIHISFYFLFVLIFTTQIFVFIYFIPI